MKCVLKKAEINDLQALYNAFDVARSALLDRLTDIKDEWQEEFDEASERWQESDAGQEASDRINTLDAIIAEVDAADVDMDCDELTG